MIKEDLKKGLLISGTGRKYNFDTKLYLQAKDFILKKFSDIKEYQANDIINYLLVTQWKDENKKSISKKVVNARLKNIVALDYTWKEFFGI